MRRIFLAFFLTLVLAKNQVMVTMNMGGGAEDPSWKIEDADADLIEAIYSNADPEYRPWPWFRMGYRGFEVVVVEYTGLRNRPVTRTSHVVYGNSKLERTLLQTAPNTVHPAVTRHMLEHLAARPLAAPAKPEHLKEANAECTVPIRGPDNETVYNPSTDDCGYFVSHASQNNCYAYGSDIVTNTFPQPGRGSGKKWSYNTCDDIRAAAERDGLEWAGTTLPTTDLKKGHWVSLHIWPATNFHWLRKDTNLPTHWSHKPGGTPVRDVDNNGRKITDPSKADISPWSQFCGYMIVYPSNATLN